MGGSTDHLARHSYHEGGMSKYPGRNRRSAHETNKTSLSMTLLFLVSTLYQRYISYDDDRSCLYLEASELVSDRVPADQSLVVCCRVIQFNEKDSKIWSVSTTAIGCTSSFGCLVGTMMGETSDSRPVLYFKAVQACVPAV